MKCEAIYCIFNRKCLCTSQDEIKIDSFGICDSYVIVSISEEELELMKKEQLAEWEEMMKEGRIYSKGDMPNADSKRIRELSNQEKQVICKLIELVLSNTRILEDIYHKLSDSDNIYYAKSEEENAYITVK